jgi:hypothetical protein
MTAPLTIAWRDEDVSPAVQRLLDLATRLREIAPGLARRN